MSVLFRGALVAAVLAIVSIAPAAAQTIKEGTAVVVTSKGESKIMKHRHKTVPAGYEPATGNTAIIMLDGKMYVKSNIHDREHDLDFTPGGN